MFPRPATVAMLAMALLWLAAGGLARADALVGASTRVEFAPAALSAPDEKKALYRRPETVPFPDANRYTSAKAWLGQLLFHDTRLSGSGTLACVSCHNAGFGYGDGLVKAVGRKTQPLLRRSPTIVNSAWSDAFMWDGRADSLETQALMPIVEPTEMDQPLGHLMQTLCGIREYPPLFAAAFANQTVTARNVADAIATYERTIVSARAPFDAWIDGDEAAITAAAKRGFELFNNRARCGLCHSDWSFSDNGFHDIGLPDLDNGRGQLLPQVIKMQHAFKTPGLREVSRRGPFMHDGSLPSLAAVVAHYNTGGINRGSRSELVGPLHLSAQDQSDLVAFMNTLTSKMPPDLGAALPR